MKTTDVTMFRPSHLGITATFVLGLVMAIAAPARADSGAARDKRSSAKAAMALQREVVNQCDRDNEHRGKGYQAVMRAVHAFCGHDLAAGCSISGSGRSFVLHKLVSKQTREKGASKSYPRGFEDVLLKHCKD